MSPESFKYFLNLVGQKIYRQDTNLRKATAVNDQLCLTIHYLAYEDSQQPLSFLYRIGKSTISKIIYKTCVAFWEALKDAYVNSPTTPTELEKVSDEILRIWNLHYRVGAIDCKHIAIKSTLKSGLLHYTYKGYFSMVLMAICDARYCFTLVDIGSYGANNASDIFRNFLMGEKVFSRKMNLPLPAPLENSPLSLNIL